MLTLLLLRHAKAVPQSGGDDFARALTEKGHADAARLGAFLAQEQLAPDQALVSTSARTRQTLVDVEKALGHAIRTTYDDTLYNATQAQTRDMLRTVDASVKTLMIVGHNPGIVDMALALADSGDPHDVEAMRTRFPPCSLVVIAFDRETWNDVRYGGGRLDRFVTPDLLSVGS